MAEQGLNTIGTTNVGYYPPIMWPDFRHPTSKSCNYNSDIVVPFDSFCVIRGYSPRTTDGGNDNMSWEITINGGYIHSWNGVNNSSWYPVSVFVRKGDVIHLWSNLNGGSMSAYFFPLVLNN